VPWPINRHKYHNYSPGKWVALPWKTVNRRCRDGSEENTHDTVGRGLGIITTEMVTDGPDSPCKVELEELSHGAERSTSILTNRLQYGKNSANRIKLVGFSWLTEHSNLIENSGRQLCLDIEPESKAQLANILMSAFYQQKIQTDKPGSSRSTQPQKDRICTSALVAGLKPVINCGGCGWNRAGCFWVEYNSAHFADVMV
jgi:hypothetical protein